MHAASRKSYLTSCAWPAVERLSRIGNPAISKRSGIHLKDSAQITIKGIIISRTLKVAINPRIINKIEFDPDPRWEIFTTKCENVEITLAEFVEHVNQGHAFCAQHKNNRKKDINFTGSDILTVDIDKGITVDDALTDPFVQQYAAMLYTTPSHTPEKHRFRIVFLLERTITDRYEMRNAYQGVIRKFGGDVSCSDACRGFFGSKGSNPITIGNILSNEELAKIITVGTEKRISDCVSTTNGSDVGSKATQVSSIPLEKNQWVKLARENGQMMPLADLSKLTSIYCPKHTDFRPSAVVITNKSGVNGVFCHTCHDSFWLPDELQKKRKPYNFYEIEGIVNEEDYYQTPSNFYDMDADDAHASLLDEVPGERTSHIFDKQYLSDIPMHDGVTFVRSPKGSGKSEWLSTIVTRCRKLGQSVLLVGHRQTLIQGIAKRLHLTCYFYNDGTKIKNNQPEDYYAICVDSIGKLLKPDYHKFDVVIIDESEQVFSHLTADTLRSKRRACYIKMFHYLRVAKSVIVADADLGPITIMGVFHAVKNDTPYQFYLNQHKESRCDFNYYESGDHLEQDMIEAIRSGGRHYVATNSKNKAEILLETIHHEFGDTRKTMLVTSGTTGDPVVQNFVNNIKSEILKYDVVIASPTLGTGIDITFDDQAQYIDTVFGFFVSRVNTHFDIDQQLARVRHPKAIKVWVTPERFGFETEPDVVRMEVLGNSALNDILIGYEDDGRHKLDETYLSVYSYVTAISRASKNNLRDNLLNLRLRNGWEVKHILSQTELAKEGKGRVDQAKEVLNAKRIDNVCGATKITHDDYQSLCTKSLKGCRLTINEEYSMRRQEIESFYREEISSKLVILDNDGRYRSQVRMMQLYLSPWHHLKPKSLSERKAGYFVTDTTTEPLKKALLYDLLAAAGLADKLNPIKTGVVVSQNLLNAFATVCQAESTKIQELFGINVRTKDLHTKTVQKLGKILELIGLKHLPPTREKINGVNTYYYELDAGTWDLVRGIVDKRMCEIVKGVPTLDLSFGPSKMPNKKKKVPPALLWGRE